MGSHIAIDSPPTLNTQDSPTYSYALAWLVIALVAFVAGGLTINYFLGSAAIFSAGISAALFVDTARRKVNARRPVALLQAQIQQLQADLLAATAEMERLREEHEFDRQLGHTAGSQKDSSSSP